MYLELHIESNEPQVFLLDQAEYMIGYLEENDIPIPVESISKKHVKLVCENKKWFATDQGSTNGTFIDGTRLVPGQRKEIFVNQYLRLGDSVHIALIKTPDHTNEVPKYVPKPAALPRPLDEKTKVINLKDLNEANHTPKITRKPVMTEKAKPADEKKKEVKEKKISTKTLVTAFIILLVGYYLNKQFTEDLSINKTNLPQKATDFVKKSSSEADKVTE